MCSCGAGYTGHINQVLYRHISEYYPSWLSKGENKSINSSILKHLMNSGHMAPSHKSFKIIYTARQFVSKRAQFNESCSVEELAIDHLKHELCERDTHRLLFFHDTNN